MLSHELFGSVVVPVEVAAAGLATGAMAKVGRDAYLVVIVHVQRADEIALGPENFFAKPVRRDRDDVAGPEVPRLLPYTPGGLSAEHGAAADESPT